MYGSWAENVVLWRNFLGFIWDIKSFNNVLIIFYIFRRRYLIIF